MASAHLVTAATSLVNEQVSQQTVHGQGPPRTPNGQVFVMAADGQILGNNKTILIVVPARWNNMDNGTIKVLRDDKWVVASCRYVVFTIDDRCLVVVAVGEQYLNIWHPSREFRYGTVYVNGQLSTETINMQDHVRTVAGNTVLKNLPEHFSKLNLALDRCLDPHNRPIVNHMAHQDEWYHVPGQVAYQDEWYPNFGHLAQQVGGCPFPGHMAPPFGWYHVSGHMAHQDGWYHVPGQVAYQVGWYPVPGHMAQPFGWYLDPGHMSHQDGGYFVHGKHPVQQNEDHLFE